MQEALSPAQETEAQELAAVLTQLAGEDLLAMARVLVAGPPGDVFGENEFKLRDLAHRVAAKAAQARLKAAKKAAARPD
jgi:hypothetical protein